MVTVGQNGRSAFSDHLLWAHASIIGHLGAHSSSFIAEQLPFTGAINFVFSIHSFCKLYLPPVFLGCRILLRSHIWLQFRYGRFVYSVSTLRLFLLHLIEYPHILYIFLSL